MDHNDLDYNNMDYNNMDYGTMDSHYVCDLCGISFSAHKVIHGLETGEEHHSYGKHVNMEQLSCFSKSDCSSTHLKIRSAE